MNEKKTSKFYTDKISDNFSKNLIDTQLDVTEQYINVNLIF